MEVPTSLSRSGTFLWQHYRLRRDDEGFLRWSCRQISCSKPLRHQAQCKVTLWSLVSILSCQGIKIRQTPFNLLTARQRGNTTHRGNAPHVFLSEITLARFETPTFLCVHLPTVLVCCNITPLTQLPHPNPSVLITHWGEPNQVMTPFQTWTVELWGNFCPHFFFFAWCGGGQTWFMNMSWWSDGTRSVFLLGELLSQKSSVGVFSLLIYNLCMLWWWCCWET